VRFDAAGRGEAFEFHAARIELHALVRTTASLVERTATRENQAGALE
jgi:hypothetical protein